MLKDLRSLVTNSIIYGVGNIAVKLIGIVLFPLYTTRLSVSEYGILGLLEVTSQFIVAVFGLNLYAALFRLYFDKQNIPYRKEMFFTVMAFLVFIVSLATIFLSQFDKQISLILFQSVEFHKLIKLMVLSSAIQIVVNIPATILRIKEKAILFTLSNLVKLLVTLFTIIYFIRFRGLKIDGIYLGTIIGNISYFIFLLPFIVRVSKPVFNIPLLKQMLNFSLPLIFASIGGVLLNISDRYVLKYYSSLHEIGLYSTAFKIANLLLFIIMAIQLAITPILYRKIDEEDNQRFYSKLANYIAFFVLFTTLGLSAFSQEAIKILARNPEYWESIALVPVLALAIYFGSLRYYFATGLNISKKTGHIAIITLGAFVLNITLNVVLVPVYNSLGAAIATVITQIIYAVCTLIVAQRSYYIRYEYKNLIKLNLVGLALIAFIYYLNTFDHTGIRLLLKTVVLISYPVILYFLGFYEQIEIVSIKGFIRKYIRR